MWPGVDFLSMTNCLFEAHVKMMPSIRAERVLDLAQAAVYPLHLQHAPRQAQDWWQRLMSDAQDTIETVRAVGTRGPRFLFNGVAVGVGALKEKLSAALGRGLAA